MNAAKKASADAKVKKHRVFTMSFAGLYPAYVNKAEKKGRTRAEVDEIIRWLTGYSDAELADILKGDIDVETFYERAPRVHPNVSLIQGVVCGVRIEAIEDPLMRKIRYLDKLIDELAKGKKMETILRR